MEHITDHQGTRVIIKDGSDIFIRIDNLHNWMDYDGLSLDRQCLASITNFLSILSLIKLEDLQTAQNIYLVEEKEVYDFDKFYKPRFKYIFEVIEFFKFIGVYDKVTFLNNNLNGNYKSVKHLPIISFLLSTNAPNMPIEQLKGIRKKATHYRFSFLNRKKKKHRTEIYNFLNEEDLLNKCLYSIDCFDKEENTVGEKWTTRHLPIKLFSSCLINLVTETCFYTSDYSGDSCFITEKTDKSLSHMMPFIVVGNPYSLHHLHRLGFKTFNEIWDESYDTTLDDNLRMKKIKSLIKEISNWSDHKIREVIPPIMKIVEYNYLRHKELKDLKTREKIYCFDTTGHDFYDFIFSNTLVKN